jgi:hypothetical protein
MVDGVEGVFDRQDEEIKTNAEARRALRSAENFCESLKR